MIQRFIRKTNLSLILLACVILMGVGTLATWGYAIRLHGQVKDALAVPVKAEPTADPATTATDAGSPGDKHANPRKNHDGKDDSNKDGKRDNKDSKKVELPPELGGLVESKSLFGRPPSGNFAFQAIVDDKALLRGNWMSVGEEKDGLRLVEIHNDGVVVESDGQRQELSLWPPMPGTQGRGTYSPPPDVGAGANFGNNKDKRDKNADKPDKQKSKTRAWADLSEKEKGRLQEMKKKVNERIRSGQSVPPQVLERFKDVPD